MSFLIEYTDYKINELKELGIHPEKPDERYDVNASDVKDHSTLNKLIITVITVPWIFMALGVMTADPRHVPEPVAEEPAQAAAPAEAAPAAANAEAAPANAEAAKGDADAMPAGEGENAKPAAPKAQ